MRILVLLPLFALTGCFTLAKTAVDVATLPVKVVGKGVDLATTSQAEADQNRGRALRKAEEAYGRAARDWEKDCEKRTRRGEQCPPRPVFVPPEN